MNYRQLTGGAAAPPTTKDGRLIIGVIVALATIIGGLAWGYSAEPATATPPAAPAGPTATVPAVRVADDAQDRQLHLAHAEQELVRAAEQLAQARRLLAARVRPSTATTSPPKSVVSTMPGRPAISRRDQWSKLVATSRCSPPQEGSVHESDTGPTHVHLGHTLRPKPRRSPRHHEIDQPSASRAS